MRISRSAPAALAGLCSVASGQAVVVSAQCNIYSAGHASPQSNCSTSIGPGVLPIEFQLPPGSLYVEFHNVIGTVLYCPTCGPANTADGTAAQITFDPLAGISGITATRGRFLEGIFLSAAEPADPAPPALTFTDFSFTQLSPGIAQHFFIGDGLSEGTLIRQRFVVPAGATRLFLGFSDGFLPCVGAYDDNSGEISAIIAPWTCSAAPQLQPLDSQTACPTGSALYSIAASGGGPFAYQWQIQTSPGVWSALTAIPTPLPCGGSASAANPAASSTTIQITPCPGIFDYRIRAAVTNQCGQSVSNEAAYSVCYANCDCSTTAPVLNVLDFSCFLNRFAAGDPLANCDGSSTPPVLNVLDFSCFLNRFAAGCP